MKNPLPTLHRLGRFAAMAVELGVAVAFGGVVGPAINRTERPLTEKEIATCLPIFGNTVDYNKVRIADGPLTWFQGGNNLTLGNTIYADDKKPVLVSDNIADADRHDDVLIHEMVHVWQHQQQKPCGIQGALALWWEDSDVYRYRKAYRYYEQDYQSNDLSQYNFEQQASLIGDFAAIYRISEKLSTAEDTADVDKCATLKHTQFYYHYMVIRDERENYRFLSLIDSDERQYIAEIMQQDLAAKAQIIGNALPLPAWHSNKRLCKKGPYAPQDWPEANFDQYVQQRLAAQP